MITTIVSCPLICASLFVYTSYKANASGKYAGGGSNGGGWDTT
jgi:hypothetical protein